jgi:Protein of unknown function (DUF3987)
MSAPDSAADAHAAPWPELDLQFLQMDRPAVPPFPLEVVPDAWRPWIEGHAQSSTCVDYIAQGLLASVSAVCGSRFVVDVTPHWREPLVLWQALVGGPSTGKTPALVAARRLLASVTAPPDTLPPEEKPRVGAPQGTAWLFYRGISSWYDHSHWLAALSRDEEERAMAIGGWTGDPSSTGDHALEVGARKFRWSESIFGTVQADRLAETLSEIDEALLSRFLYSWPVSRRDARLDGASGDADGARRLMQRLVDLPGKISQPAVLTLKEAAAERLQELLPQLRAFMRDADGVHAAWIGKAAGNIIRLAGLLGLMEWAETGGKEPCTCVEERHLAAAHRLWTDYFWPHAQVVLGHAPFSLAERRLQRVGRWLRRVRPPTISREEVRREALGQTVDADAAERVIERLERYGAVRMLPVVKESRRGPAKVRWQVNPELWGIAGN